MTTNPNGWHVNVATNDPTGFMSNYALIGIGRVVHDGFEVCDGQGVIHRYDHGQATDPEHLIRIPRDAVLALRDALTAETKGAPNEATIAELRAALAVEQARTDATLAALLRPAPSAPEETPT